MYNCVFWRMIQKSKSDLVEFKVELWWEYSHPSYNSGTGCYLLLRGYSVAQCHDVILLSGYHFSNAPWGPTGPNLFFLLLQWNSKHVGWCWGSEVSTRGWWCSLCSPAPYTQQPLLSIGLCFNKKKKNAPAFFFFFFLFEKHTNPNRHTGTGGIFFSSWGEGGKVHVRPHIYICRVFVETGVWPPVTVLVHLAASTGAHINLFTLTFLCKHLRRSKPPLKKSVYTQRFYDPHSDRFRWRFSAGVLQV